jgi:hypothetical protein
MRAPAAWFILMPRFAVVPASPAVMSIEAAARPSQKR